MKHWTVIGLYETGETYAAYAAYEEADDAWAAMAKAAVQAENSHNPDLEILGAIEGQHTLIPACDDSGKAAMACDMAGLAEEE